MPNKVFPGDQGLSTVRLEKRNFLRIKWIKYHNSHISAFLLFFAAFSDRVSTNATKVVNF